MSSTHPPHHTPPLSLHDALPISTSNIDSETEELIQHAMKIVSRDRTTFIIAHRLSTVQHSDQIILLEDGRIAEQGDHAALMKAGGEYSRMYEMQVTGRPA